MKKLSKYLSGGSMLLLALFVVNIINFIFNAYLGRVLTFEQFGIVTLISTMWYLALIPINAVSGTINHRSAYLIAKYNTQAGKDFLDSTNKKNLYVALIATVFWIIAIPYIDSFFQIGDYLVSLLFTPIILLGLIAAANRGFLQGNFNFKSVAAILLIEAFSKIILAWLFVTINLQHWVYTTIPLSVFISFIFALWFTSRVTEKKKPTGKYKFPKRFLTAALFTGIASTAILSFDLLLVKHFLSPVEAGQYAVLSLVGKMVYFFGSLPSVLIISYVGKDNGKNRDPKRSFYKLFSMTIFLTIGSFLGLVLFGSHILPFLLGDKTTVILPYLTKYAAAISLFTISGSIVSYHLAKQQYMFSILAICMSLGMAIGILLYHGSISQITQVIFSISLVSMVVVGILHIIEANKLTDRIVSYKKGFLNKYE